MQASRPFRQRKQQTLTQHSLSCAAICASSAWQPLHVASALLRAENLTALGVHEIQGATRAGPLCDLAFT
eukprot:1944853-Alexandrium_andersonii.AAC.1